MNDENKHDMPDPLDFVPGLRTPEQQSETGSVVIEPTKPKVSILSYASPMIINLIIFGVVQAWVSGSTNSLPIDERGESGAAWLQFIILPIEFVVFVICLIILLIGISRKVSSEK